MAFLPFLAAAASAVSAVGSVMGGLQAKAMGDFQATQYEDAAKQASAQGLFEETQIRSQSREYLGASRATVGESGIQLQGSPIKVIEQSMANYETDALMARYNASLESRGLYGRAQAARIEGRNARTAGYIGAASKLLQAGADFGYSKMGSSSTPNYVPKGVA